MPAALLLSVGLAPAAAAKCFPDVDKFSGATTTYCAMGGLFSGGSLATGAAGLDPFPSVRIEESGDIVTFIRVLWRGEDWLYMNPGTELVFITDGGERIKLISPDGSSIERAKAQAIPELGMVTVREEAIFPVSLDDFRKLAASRTLEYAVFGGSGRVERTIGEAGTKFYRELLDTVITPAMER